MNANKFLTITRRTKRQIELQRLNSSPSNPLIPKVIDFLRAEFHPNEPLNRSIQLMSREQDRKTLDALYMSCIPSGANVIAVDGNNEIIGVLLNEIHVRGQPDAEITTPDWNPTPVYATFFDAMASIKDGLNLFGKYAHANRIMDHVILSVSSEWQRDGVSQILVNYCHDVLAKELNSELSIVFCSSFYSAKVFEHCGYEEIFSKAFRDYKKGDQFLFPTETPHDFITCKLKENSIN